MTPTELTGLARRLLQTKGVDDPEAVERASALLARQAIEQCAAAILSRYGLDANKASFTSQLLCLQGVMAEKDLARDIAAVWGTLSGVLHHDTLELSPTETELLELIQRAETVVRELEQRETRS